MRARRIAFVAVLVLLTLACSLGGQEEPTPTPTRSPTRTPTEEPPTPTPTEEMIEPEDCPDYRLEPNYGSDELASGFLPDPYSVELISGGDVDVSGCQLGYDCYGYATSAPDFRLFLEDDSQGIRIFFVADVLDQDTILIVNTPDGEWTCNDDHDSGADPLVQLVPAPAGQYDIWVASYFEQEFVAGTLYITEWDLTPADYRDGGMVPGGDDSQLDYTLEPNFGSDELSSGFLPDPYLVELISGGNVDVSTCQLGYDCTGYATAAPDFRLFLEDGSEGIRIFFVADAAGEDTALIVNAADGEWTCNDDYDSLVDPLVQLVPAPAGQYDIWVASYSDEEFVAGTLYITEWDLTPADYRDGGMVPGGDEWGLDFTLDPTFGQVDLAPGFTPDPFMVAVLSGGPVDVSALGLEDYCRGYAASAPDFRINLTESSPRLRVFFVADVSMEDTTLIINLPTGAWVCGDDSVYTYNPLIDVESAPAGTYDIWIGSYVAEDMVAGTLYVTESDYTPADLP
jgi:hypothetical protein